MGEDIFKRNKYQGLDYRTLGKLLEDPVLENLLGDDGTFFYRGILTDRRCWNFRNNLCHGLIRNIGDYDVMSRWLFLILMQLGLIRRAGKVLLLAGLDKNKI